MGLVVPFCAIPIGPVILILVCLFCLCPILVCPIKLINKLINFSHTSGSQCQANRRQLTLLFLKTIQPNIIRNVRKNTVILNNVSYKLRKTP